MILDAVEEPLCRELIVWSGSKNVGEIWIGGKVRVVEMRMLICPLRQGGSVAEFVGVGRRMAAFLGRGRAPRQAGARRHSAEVATMMMTLRHHP